MQLVERSQQDPLGLLESGNLAALNQAQQV
jgi:hypothetical protein